LGKEIFLRPEKQKGWTLRNDYFSSINRDLSFSKGAPIFQVPMCSKNAGLVKGGCAGGHFIKYWQAISWGVLGVLGCAWYLVTGL